LLEFFACVAMTALCGLVQTGYTDSGMKELPTRTQQLGLIIVLVVLAIYVILRVH